MSDDSNFNKLLPLQDDVNLQAEQEASETSEVVELRPGQAMFVRSDAEQADALKANSDIDMLEEDLGELSDRITPPDAR